MENARGLHPAGRAAPILRLRLRSQGRSGWPDGSATGYSGVKPDAETVQAVPVRGRRRQAGPARGTRCAGPDRGGGRANRPTENWPNEGLPGELAQVLPTPEHFEQATPAGHGRDMAESFVCGPTRRSTWPRSEVVHRRRLRRGLRAADRPRAGGLLPLLREGDPAQTSLIAPSELRGRCVATDGVARGLCRITGYTIRAIFVRNASLAAFVVLIYKYAGSRPRARSSTRRRQQWRTSYRDAR